MHNLEQDFLCIMRLEQDLYLMYNVDIAKQED